MIYEQLSIIAFISAIVSIAPPSVSSSAFPAVPSIPALAAVSPLRVALSVAVVAPLATFARLIDRDTVADLSV